MILEVHLNNLIAQSEHNRMLCSHPLLNIYEVTTSFSRLICHIYIVMVLFVTRGLSCTLASVILKVRPEMLEKSYFLSKVFGIVSKGMSCHYILL